MTQKNIQYPDDFIDRLEIIWGEGFLSPGGAEEVEKILEGIDLEDKDILDIGCGTGGVELMLGKKVGDGSVTGIDVEPQLVERTRLRIEQAGIGNSVGVMLIEPGPLDFADASFDIVFSKDSLIHIQDKPALISEVLRVLRPGGVFTASDWLVGENADDSPEWAKYKELGHLSFKVATAVEMEKAMNDAGFTDVSTLDRNAWYAPITIEEVQQLEGPLWEGIVAVSDIETCEHWLAVRRALRDATNAGALCPTHLRGFKKST